MKVVRIFSRLNIGGPSIHVLWLTAGLASRGYSTDLFIGQETEREGNMLPLADQLGVTPQSIPGLGREIRPLSDARAFVAIWRLLRARRPEIVHTHTAKAGMLGRIAARAAGVPVVVHTFHGHVLSGYFGRLGNSAFTMIERLLARATDAIITVSDGVAEDLARLRVGDRRKVSVIPLGLDLQPLTQVLPRTALRQGLDERTPLVGIVGRLVPIKNVAAFLDAAAQIRERRLDVRYAVVGDGDERASLETRAVQLGVSEIVRFHGWRRDMRDVYGSLDLVVNCSSNEGTPVALIEAMAAGRPVVATDVGGNRDLVGAGNERGALVPPDSPADLAAAIMATLEGGARVRDRVSAARAYVLERHSVGRLLADVDRLYRTLLGRRPVP